MSFSIELLPARHGDAILVCWGESGDRHRMLVDAGPATAYDGVGSRLAAEGTLDVLVLTHVDADHVEGMILLVNDAAAGVGIGEVWFNARRHFGEGRLHGAHGEMLSALVVERRIPWNLRFGGEAVCSDAGIRSVELPGGLRVTVLAPSAASLKALENDWVKACRDAKVDGSVESVLAALRTRPRLVPAESYLDRPARPKVRQLARSVRSPDDSRANASTIVLLLEIDGRAVLLCGDATPESLLTAVRNLLAVRGLDRLTLDAMTVPHHGSERNITPELVAAAPSRRYLFSSNGSHYRHPHAAAVATVVEFAPRGAELVFNYATPYSSLWDDERLQEEYGYRVRFPTSSDGGVLVDLDPLPGR